MIASGMCFVFVVVFARETYWARSTVSVSICIFLQLHG
jgi:hypothetical protein